ncbi:uncharacterized protein [Rhodnius prolixus]|uniref:uncharacterized protein n=1 Tax=Rhodnius prolixus TaxID=13249 RepID=UPI003D18A660
MYVDYSDHKPSVIPIMFLIKLNKRAISNFKYLIETPAPLFSDSNSQGRINICGHRRPELFSVYSRPLNSVLSLQTALSITHLKEAPRKRKSKGQQLDSNPGPPRENPMS